MYKNPLYDYCICKDDPYCIILTIGCDRLPYTLDSGSPTVTLLEAKITSNRVISTPGSQFIFADIKDFFLFSPMEHFKYIEILFRCIPEEIRTQYNLYSLVEPDRYVHFELRKIVYRLKQATRLVLDNLVKLLAPHGHFPFWESPGLRKHQTRSMVFILWFYDFCIKSNSMDNAQHLINAIKDISNAQSIGKV